jgi:hypothetical protein
MEYYIKDPRYLVVDNKPVITLYSMSGLKRDFGDVADIKAEMDYIRSACVEAGFSGAYLLVTTSAVNNIQLSELKSAGFDCAYNYSWGMSAGIVENQMNSLTAERDAGGLDMMTTLAMGRDDTPWERSPGTWASVEDFGRLLDWGKNTFIPSLPQNSLGKRFVMFGNWNEYGEGHFLSPTNWQGFGYLDEIKRVFSANDTPCNDEKPTARQRERINRMYIQERELPRPYLSQGSSGDAVPENIKYKFDFKEDTQGFTVAKQVDNFRQEDGAVKGTANDNDPGIFSPADLDYSIGDVSHVRARMKIGTTGDSVVIYFITESSTNWQEAKKLSAALKSDGDGYTDLVFDARGIGEWKGKLKQIRLDPLTTPGDFAVEYIEFLSDKKEGALSLKFNGEESFFVRPLVMENGTFLAPSAEMGGFLEMKSGDSIDGSVLKILSGETYIELPYNVSEAKVNGEARPLRQPSVKIDGQSYFPLRFVAENLGYTVEWDNDENTASVSAKEDEDGSAAVVYPPDEEGAFNFRNKGDLQGWAPNGGCSDAKAANDVLSFTSTNTDPFFSRAVKYKAEDYPKLFIRLKNQTSGTTFQMYFATDKDTAINEAKSVRLSIEADSGEFKEYSAALPSNWSDTITSLRMDPTNQTGKFEIDYVIFGAEDAVKALSRGGNLIENGNMDAQGLNHTAEGAKTEYTNEQGYIGRYSLKATKTGDSGTVLIPAPLVRDMAYEYDFWLYSPDGAEIEAGIESGGKKTPVKTVKPVAKSSWEKIKGSFTQGETDENARLYISSGGEYWYIDGINLRPMN